MVRSFRRPVLVLVVAASLLALLPLRAQDAPQQGTPQQGAPAQDAPPQQPVFRADVDIIEMDVSVLDRNRRPVRGLTAADFTVLEDGRPQRVVAVSHVDLADQDRVRSARMRYVTRDVAANDLSDQLGDGRLIAIVFDDVNLPADDPEIVRSARETARYIVDRLGPSDMAAVIYAHNAGRTQDFTDDRAKLLQAIDRFQPAALDWIGPTPQGTGAVAGDMQQWSPTLVRSSCMRGEPAVPTLDTVASRLATAPGRRKALMFISVGVALSLSATDACGAALADVMKGVFRKAQQANVNIYGIDPAGAGGYQDYLRLRAAQRGQESMIPGRRRVPRNIRALQDFMRVMADQTGGLAVINTDAVDPAIDQILDEDLVYYLVGYESTRGAPDGRFRKVEISVNRPWVSVRSRSGYWAPAEGDVVERRPGTDGPSSMDSAMSGLNQAQGLPLRVSAIPVARVAPAGAAVARGVEVAAVLSVGFPPLRAAVDDTLTITRNVYDAAGRAGPPTRIVERVRLEPGGGDEARHDLLQRLTLEPGQYQIRYHVQSTLLDARGTVFVDVDVPDLSRATLALSGLMVAASGASGTSHTGDLAALAPVVPTSNRDFSASQVLTGFLRVYQAGSERVPVAITAELFDASDVRHYENAQTIEATGFEPDGGAPLRFDVPLSRLKPGPHLLSVTARLPGGRTARRDVVFRVR